MIIFSADNQHLFNLFIIAYSAAEIDEAYKDFEPSGTPLEFDQFMMYRFPTTGGFSFKNINGKNIMLEISPYKERPCWYCLNKGFKTEDLPDPSLQTWAKVYGTYEELLKASDIAYEVV